MALQICQFFTSQGMTFVPRPPCSPDLAPANFFVSLNEKRLERALIWHCGGHHSFDKSAEQHPI
jgi:hypothetical protein